MLDVKFTHDHREGGNQDKFPENVLFWGNVSQILFYFIYYVFDLFSNHC